jgi:leucyl-tRNA synthetase
MVLKDGTVMSKSKGNIVDPRKWWRSSAPTPAAVHFICRPTGARHGLARIRSRRAVPLPGPRLSLRHAQCRENGPGRAPETSGDRRALRKLHQTVDKVTQDFDTRWHFNTSIAAIMELVNELHAQEAELTGGVIAEVLEKLILLLGPFAPYAAEEMWEEIGHTGPVFLQPWPKFDPELAREEEAEIVVQINGKLRGRVYAAHGASREKLEQLATANEKIQPLLEGKKIVKVIVVLGKLVNIVAK